MYRIVVVWMAILLMVVGCSHSIPVFPDTPNTQSLTQTINDSGPHRLFGEWTLYFSEDHTRVDAVPQRTARLHLNSTRFLEEYCTTCLTITGITKNYDGTINMGVRVVHPFAGLPQFTAFDVKGIIMFEGSHTMNLWSDNIFPYYDKVRVSWRELGDPELLNPDGYSPRWSPWWDTDSTMPIFSYWPGKYSSGTPSANINAYINFYTDEERHMFETDGVIEKTYHISLPPGPVVAGYAIEGCWEPPINTPVTDPLNDFPYSANQEEPYFFQVVINNGEVIDYDPCCGYEEECEDFRIELTTWDGQYEGENEFKGCFLLPAPHNWIKGMGSPYPICSTDPSGDPVWLKPHYADFTDNEGIFRGVCIIYRSQFVYNAPDIYSAIAYTVFDFTVDLE